jgi:hypothetical protein
LKNSYSDFLVGIAEGKAIISIESKLKVRKRRIRLFDGPKQEARNWLVVGDEVESHRY